MSINKKRWNKEGRLLFISSKQWRVFHNCKYIFEGILHWKCQLSCLRSVLQPTFVYMFITQRHKNCQILKLVSSLVFCFQFCYNIFIFLKPTFYHMISISRPPLFHIENSERYSEIILCIHFVKYFICLINIFFKKINLYFFL